MKYSYTENNVLQKYLNHNLLLPFTTLYTQSSNIGIPGCLLAGNITYALCNMCIIWFAINERTKPSLSSNF